jgi:signal transduction histidine kinase
LRPSLILLDLVMPSVDAGADDFIPKSSEFEVLKARVRAQLRRKQFEDEHRKVREQLMHRELEAAEERSARRLAETKATLVDELERKNKELEAFSYSVSHDLRAPLRSIDGFSQLVLENYADKLDEKGRSHLRRVCAAAQRMGELIDDLLELSRVSRAELSRDRACISDLARALSAEIQRREPDREATFVIGDGLVVEADSRTVDRSGAGGAAPRTHQPQPDHLIVASLRAVPKCTGTSAHVRLERLPKLVGLRSLQRLSPKRASPPTVHGATRGDNLIGFTCRREGSQP